MFTLKLYRGHTSKFIEAESLEVFSAGPASGIDEDPTKRTNDVREISCVIPGKPAGAVFYISTQKCWASELSKDVFHYAYIENANGRTTERIYPY